MTGNCPCCGNAFTCGASDATPCACTMLTLDARLLAELRVRYAGCLCLPCLHALSGRQQEKSRSHQTTGLAPAPAGDQSLR